MKKTGLLLISLLLILSLTACNMGLFGDDSGDSHGGGTVDTSYTSNVWDSASNANYIYYHSDENDTEGTLTKIEYYDVDSEGRVVFIRANRPPVDGETYGAVIGADQYVWDENDQLIQHAYYSYGEQGYSLASHYVYEYNTDQLLSASYGFDGEGNLTSGKAYDYDADGNVWVSATVDWDGTTAEITAGTEFQYDLDKDVLYRRSVHKDIDLGTDVGEPGTLKVSSASCQVSKPSLSAPGTCSYEGTYNDDGNGAPLLTIPADPGIDLGSDSLRNQVYALPHIWDSYWFYDEYAGTDAYWGVTFSMDPVPVAVEIDNAFNYYFELLDESAQEYEDLYADYKATYGPEAFPENVHVPVQFYLDGGRGIEYDDLDFELDYPITIDLEYLPGFHVVASKSVKYGNTEIIRLDNSFHATNGRLEGIRFTGEALPLPVELELGYQVEDNEGDTLTADEELLKFWVDSLDISVNDVLAQKFVYQYTTDDPSALNEMGYLGLVQNAIQTLWWYDGDYDDSLEDNTDDLVGRFEFVYAKDDTTGNETVTLNAYGKDDVYTGKYELNYNVLPDEHGFIDFTSYDSNDTALFNFDMSYDDAIQLANDAINDADIDYTDVYNTITDQLVEVGAVEDTESVPAIPQYLLEGFNATDTNSRDLVILLINEVQALIP